MLCIRPGEHGSTYGGYDLSIYLLAKQSDERHVFSNPLGCAVAMTALDVLVEENLAQRAYDLGKKFRAAVSAIKSPLVKTVRGRGLLNALVIDEEKSVRGRTAWQLCLLLKSRGVLAKPTHVNMLVSITLLSSPVLIPASHSIRFAPPLVISEEDLMKAVRIIGECLEDLDKVSGHRFLPSDNS